MTEVGRLSWDEIAHRIAGDAIAILPVGAGAKAHGFHLPMRTDEIQAGWLAEHLAGRLDALIWPTLTYGHYPAFAAYTGSVGLSPDVFLCLVRELIDGILAQGIRGLVVIDTGISTIAPIDTAIAAAKAPERVLHLPVYRGAHYLAAVAGLATQKHGGHADEMETSIMLALAPDAVDMKRAVVGTREASMPGPLQRSDPRNPNYSASGGTGDPRGATREKGEALLNAMIGDMTAGVEAWLGTLYPKPKPPQGIRY